MLRGIYFGTGSWTARLTRYVRSQGPFASANRDRVFTALRHPVTGLRVVVNLGAEALSAMIGGLPYLNVYERPLVGGKRRQPSPVRITVDHLFELRPPKDYFFGALSSGGSGIRFYGEYCFVFKPDAVDGASQIVDRNSYDFVEPPLNSYPNAVQQLRGTMQQDAESMLALRCLQRIQERTHSITAGLVADTILRDEMFAEVHLKQRPDLRQNCEEIRIPPEDEAVMNSIWRRRREGQRVTPEEMLWSDRRSEIEDGLDRLGVRRRVVTTVGRGARWS